MERWLPTQCSCLALLSPAGVASGQARLAILTEPGGSVRFPTSERIYACETRDTPHGPESGCGVLAVYSIPEPESTNEQLPHARACEWGTGVPARWG
jgi:hypothetical protein